jgi:hypothetical protein
MAGGKLGGGDVEAVKVERGWIRVFLSEIL